MLKLCECGCGQPAPIAKYNSYTTGRIKGQPVRFIKGHNTKWLKRFGPAHPKWKGGEQTNDQGYRLILVPGHPRGTEHGYVREHIVIAERALGHPLPSQAVVHHVNEQRSENRNNNLVICENDRYHKLLHRRMRAYQATGSVSSKKCVYCKSWAMIDDPDLSIAKKGSGYHRSCHAAHERNKRKQGCAIAEGAAVKRGQG